VSLAKEDKSFKIYPSEVEKIYPQKIIENILKWMISSKIK
jgi:hypothetical protein